VAGLNSLDPDFRPWAESLVQAAAVAGLNPRVTSTRRSLAEQTRLYRQWLSGARPYPVARPGTSAHEYGLAFDLVVSPLAMLGEVGALWQSWGLSYGGERDPVHFEMAGASQWAREQIAPAEPTSEELSLLEKLSLASPIGLAYHLLVEPGATIRAYPFFVEAGAFFIR
jgi:D-alanyl-D-alanine carboxypeptidase-like protein